MTTARVDEHGIKVPASDDVPMRVRFDGEPVWAFLPSRDGSPRLGGYLVPWPERLVPLLHGRAEVSVDRVGDDSVVVAASVSFAGSDEQLVLRDAQGNPLAIDKAGRLQRTFTDFSDAERRELVDAAAFVLEDLRTNCGLDAFLSYGALLGARRDGRLIGHDADIDVSYLSAHDNPFDIIRECRRAERTLVEHGRERGWRVMRFSGANFKVVVPTAAGRNVGIDVFGAFYVGDRLHITGNLRGRLDRSAILPLSTITLEGVDLPAPGRVDDFLAFTYGPTWPTPDPSFHFEPSRETIRRMSGWLRGGRIHYRRWQNFYLSPEADRVPRTASPFAHWVAERLPEGARVVELGSGTGRDAWWLASQGFAVTGSDYSGAALRRARRLARRRRADVSFVPLNLEAIDSWLPRAALLAHQPGPVHVYARGLITAIRPAARRDLWRFCSMVGRSGGETWLEFRTPASRDQPTVFTNLTRTFADPATVAEEIAAAGGRVVEQEIGRGLAPLEHENPEICRLRVRWDR